MSIKPNSKKKLSPEQKIAQRKERARLRSFNNAHRSIFERAGFTRLTPVDGIHFTYEGIKSELDDVFVFENVVVLAEYTLSNSSNFDRTFSIEIYNKSDYLFIEEAELDLRGKTDIIQ